ncbi:hypothetical protein HAL013_12240 [Helicobacter ailurogastricus]|uniref:Uncharacterized protein n=1 Tax=Helicobacter ailurogastricus TaxID=1578720 RepID=A0A0K2X6L9_9HELI|nr:hypothetical protein HAL011_11200 [Helicobacter ailurogastricus]CRF43005.1 hypothetical protein HAL013_12240 [Helicobacter ailurogastricus]CRF44376.1 hypothetical protein HAL09_09550 [Helicobacter ailurogastricus]
MRALQSLSALVFFKAKKFNFFALQDLKKQKFVCAYTG